MSRDSLVLMSTTPTPTSGVRANSYRIELSASQYHAQKGIVSSSLLKAMLISPAHYMEEMLSPKAVGEAADFGTVGHAMVLEPHTLNEVVAVYPGKWDARSKDCKAFVLSNEGRRIVMSREDYLRVAQARDKLLDSQFKGRPFHRFLEESENEVSIFYTDPTVGVECRTRLDIYHPEFSFDLKFTRHGSANAFQRDALDRHYDLQAYMYCLARAQFEGTERNRPFVFVPVESEAPHSVHFRPSTEEFLRNGQAKYNAAIARVAACQQTEAWLAPGGEVAMELHPWQQFRKEDQLLAA